MSRWAGSSSVPVEQPAEPLGSKKAVCTTLAAVVRHGADLVLQPGPAGHLHLGPQAQQLRSPDRPPRARSRRRRRRAGGPGRADRGASRGHPPLGPGGRGSRQSGLAKGQPAVPPSRSTSAKVTAAAARTERRWRSTIMPSRERSAARSARPGTPSESNQVVSTSWPSTRSMARRTASSKGVASTPKAAAGPGRAPRPRCAGPR